MRAPIVLRQAYRAGGFVTITAVLLPLYAACDATTPEPGKARVRDTWTGRWSAALLRLFRVQRVLVGAAETRACGGDAGRLVVANHRSTIDIALLLELFGGHVMSRADLSRWPLVGAAARRTGTIFVDRASKSSGARALRQAAECLRRHETVSVFPEGTTFADDTVRQFHRGPFSAALRAHATVLPVGIAYEPGSPAIFHDETFLQHLARMSAAPPIRVAVAVSSPLEPGRDAASLAAQARDRVSDLVQQARAAL